MNRFRITPLLILPAALLLLAQTASAQLGPINPGGNPNPHPPARPGGPRGIEGARAVPAPRDVVTPHRASGSMTEGAKAYIKLGDKMAERRPPNYEGAEWAYWRAVELETVRFLRP